MANNYQTIASNFRKDPINNTVVSKPIIQPDVISPNSSGIVPMWEIPEVRNRVKVMNVDGTYKVECFNAKEVTEEKYFYVDYALGDCYFHKNELGKAITMIYRGIGNSSLYAGRVYTKLGEEGDVSETIHDIVTKGRASIDFYNASGSAIQLQDDLEATNIEALATNTILQQAIIDGGLEAIRDDIVATDSNLSTTNTNLTNVTNRVTKAESVAYERKFKPKLIKYMWTNNTVDVNGDRTIPIDRSILDQWMLLFKDLGFDGLEICIHVDYSATLSDLYYQTDLATIQYVITQANLLGIPVYLLKFHQEYNLANVATMGVETFKTRFKAMVTEVSTMFKNQDIEYMGIFNEWEFFWTTGNSYLPFVLESLAIPKVHGFKVGVSTAGLGQTGFSSWFTVDESVRQASDIFLLNMYPPASAKGSKTTKQDCLSSWETYNLFPVSEKIRTDYVGKPIIVSETGIIDKYEAYFAPGNSKWTGSATNGIAIETYMYGMLESLKEFDVLAVCWWYDLHYKIDTTYYIYSNVKKLMRQYINRGGV